MKGTEHLTFFTLNNILNLILFLDLKFSHCDNNYNRVQDTHSIMVHIALN